MYKCLMGCGLVVHDPIAHAKDHHVGSTVFDRPDYLDYPANEWTEYDINMRAYESWLSDNFDSIRFSVTNG